MKTETIEKKRLLSLCRKSALLPTERLQVNGENLMFSLHESIDQVADLWRQLTTDEEFASPEYMRTIEQDSPENLRNLYLIYSTADGEPIGSVLLQCLILRFADSFKYDKYTTDRSLISRIRQRLRQMVVSSFSFRMLTVGNLYLTGQYGFFFKEGRYSNEKQFKIILKTLKILRKQLCNTPYRFHGTLFKDYFKEQMPQNPKKLGMYEFKPDPNMILKIRPSWKSFDDYLLDMKSKYRVRIKSALKKFHGIEKRLLSRTDILRLYPEMFQLYDKILSGSGFVLAKGDKSYFLTLKEELGDKLNVYGYFNNDKLIGFYTWVLDHDKMDSHFIGFEPALNHKYQLYLNILIDLVKDAIRVNAPSLYYFRTALEIKSSVGAEPHDMSCYIRHNNFLINRIFIATAFGYFVPKQQWEQRHPFKSTA